MHLLIDADSALYKAGCANEDRYYHCVLEGQLIEEVKYKADALVVQEATGCSIEKYKVAGPVGISLHNLRKVVDSMLLTPHTSYEMFIGGEGNFRYEWFPEYKANRSSDDKPLHLNQMKKHLIGKFGAQVVDKEEVDDRVSWMQCAAPKDSTCIVSVDKDLNNTAGWHYNYARQELYYITEEEADLNFARQLLTGDSTDGIPGLKGVGKVMANKILPSYQPDWLDIVKLEYTNRGHTLAYLRQQGIALHMRRVPEEIWDCV